MQSRLWNNLKSLLEMLKRLFYKIQGIGERQRHSGRRSAEFKDLKIRQSKASSGTCGWFHVRTHEAKLVFSVMVGACPRVGGFKVTFLKFSIETHLKIFQHYVCMSGETYS